MVHFHPARLTRFPVHSVLISLIVLEILVLFAGHSVPQSTPTPASMAARARSAGVQSRTSQSGTVPHRLAASAPSPVLAAASQEILFVFDAYCEDGCLTLAAWIDDEIVPAVQLQAALALAYDRLRATHWRSYALQTAERETRVRLDDIEEPGIAGYYSSTRNTIVIDRSWAGLPTHELAALLIAHEIVHAGIDSRFPDSRRGAGLCFAEETLADSWSAVLWAQLRPYDQGTGMGQLLDDQLARYAEGTLWQEQLLTPLYHQQCFGMRLN